MTDKQSAVLLQQISRRINELSQDCDRLVFEGERELIAVWTKDTPQPTGLFINYYADGWEWRPEGELSIKKRLLEFSSQLDTDATNLMIDSSQDKEEINE